MCLYIVMFLTLQRVLKAKSMHNVIIYVAIYQQTSHINALGS